jgi:hypothetical protein
VVLTFRKWRPLHKLARYQQLWIPHTGMFCLLMKHVTCNPNTLHWVFFNYISYIMPESTETYWKGVNWGYRGNDWGSWKYSKGLSLMEGKLYLFYRWVCYYVYLILLMVERLQKYEIGKKLFLLFQFSFLLTSFVSFDRVKLGQLLLKLVSTFCNCFPLIFWKLLSVWSCIIFFL